MLITCPHCGADIATLDPSPSARTIAFRCSCGGKVHLDHKLNPVTRTRALVDRSATAPLPADADEEARLRALADAISEAQREADSAARRLAALVVEREAVARAVNDSVLALREALRKAGVPCEGMSASALRDLVKLIPRS